MTNINIEDKGSRAEEVLKRYFESNGFIVFRGVKYKYGFVDVTDVDLLIYAKIGGFQRQRINVDIKNKKTPQAIERIFWTKGLMNALDFDNCIVATTDRRLETKEFGEKLGVQVIDGIFLGKIQEKYKTDKSSLSEEEMRALLSGSLYTDSKVKYYGIIESSKQLCLSKIEFSDINKLINNCSKILIEIASTSSSSNENIRTLSFVIGCLMMTLDFRLSKYSFFDNDIKREQILEGLKFGELGKERIQTMFSISLGLVKSAGGTPSQLDQLNAEFEATMNNEKFEALSEFVGKREIANALYDSAKENLELAYKRGDIKINDFSTVSKGIIGILLDLNSIDRKVIK